MNIEINGVTFELIDELGLAWSFLPELEDLMRRHEFRELVFKTVENHGKIIYQLVADDGRESESGNAHIRIDLNAPHVEYRVDTNAWDEWERQFDHLNDDEYREALKRYESEHQWQPFSLKRHIFHETYHAAHHSRVSGLHYILKTDRYEGETIRETNRFMWKYYSEPFRKDHNTWRFR